MIGLLGERLEHGSDSREQSVRADRFQ
jgi:hypothetical protein